MKAALLALVAWLILAALLAVLFAAARAQGTG